MIEDILREVIRWIWGGALLWSWSTFMTLVAPIMIERCPFDFAQDEGPL